MTRLIILFKLKVISINLDESLTSIQVDNFIDKKLNIVNNSFGHIEQKEDMQKKMSFKDIFNDELTEFNMVEFKPKENETNVDESPVILEPIVKLFNLGSS
jgi:hypothetical protein